MTLVYLIVNTFTKVTPCWHESNLLGLKSFKKNGKIQMKSFLNKETSSRVVIKVLIYLIAAFSLASCGSNNDSNTSKQGDNISLQIPDSLLANKVNRSNLSATITIDGGTAQTMSIDDANNSATASLGSISTGNHTFVIQFTYDYSGTRLTVAEATKTITVAEGSNSLSFLASDYDTSFDQDSDGLTNLEELDATSTTNPTVSLCKLGTATLGSCELGS
jgi:hypothetical protein